MYTMKVDEKKGIPVVRFTPNFYKEAYRQYRNGIYSYVIEMMNRAETDSHVAGCIEGRRAGFQKDFILKPFSDEAADVDRAGWYDKVVKKLKPRKLFEAIHDGRMKIFSVIDFDWDIVDGKQAPIAFKKFEQKYFREDPKDHILKIDFGQTLVDIPDTALVCKSDKIPILIPVLREYILKEFGIESWAAFMETFGEPFLIAKYPPGASAPFIETLKTELEEIARSSRGVMPEGTTFEFKETTKSTGDHSLFEDRCNKGISISLLGHANAVEASKGLQVGENLSSFKATEKVSQSDMFYIDEYMQQLIEIIHDRNFADQKYPNIEIDKRPPLDQAQHRDNVDLVYRMGFPIFPEDVQKLGVKTDPDQKEVQKQQSLFEM